MTDDLDDRVTRVEDAIWGPWRNNGLVADVRAIRQHVERQEKERLADEKIARGERFKNRLTAFGISIAGLSALLTAVLTVAQR